MTTVGELPVFREDAAQLAREGQTSFEGFPSDIPWRSVSECEGIAAIALLACGQQGSASRPTSSRGGDSSGANVRCDSSAWPFLIASGGEVAPPAVGGVDRFKSASSGDEAQGTTTSSNKSGESSNGGVEGSATKKPLELGPMPTAPPFGGYKQDQASSSSSNGSGSRSGSRSGGSSRRSKGERRKAASGSRNSPTAGSMSLGASTSSIFNFFNDPNFSSSRSSSGGSPGDHSSAASAAATAAAAASGGSGRSGGGGVGGIRSGLGEAPPSPWPHHSDVPMRQKSFDPDKEIGIEHKKEMGVVPPWETGVAPDVATTGIPGHGLGPTVPAPTSRNKTAEFPAVSSKDWGVIYPRNDDGAGRGGGGGGENVRRVEYPARDVAPPPSSSSSSLQRQPWRGGSVGSDPPLAQQPARRNEKLGDGRQRPHPAPYSESCWVPAPAPGYPGPRTEHRIKPSPSYDLNPDRAQVPPQLYPHHLPSRIPPPRRSRPEDLDRWAGHRHRVNKDSIAAAAAEAAAEAAAAKSAAAEAAAATAIAAAAAAAAASAHTPPSSPPTASPSPSPPSPTPSPPPRHAAAAVASRVQHHYSPTRKAVAASPPNNVYNLLAMMIPDLAKMGGRSPDGAGAGATAEAPGSGLPGTSQRSAATAGTFSDTCSSASRSDAFNLRVAHSESTFPPPRLAATDASVGERMAMLGAGGCYGRGGIDGSLDEEEARKAQKKISIARYLRKRLRRPYVKAERDQDPNRMIQNQSRMRPRKRGKFCKKGPDYIAITRVQASSNRSISGEMPIREPPAPLRGDQSVRAVGGRVGVGAGCIGSKVGVAAWPPLGGGIKQQ